MALFLENEENFRSNIINYSVASSVLKWKFISAYTNITKEMFLKLVNYIFATSYFSLNGILYQQIDGSAMGNPASPLFANLALNEFGPIRVYRRYHRKF